MGDVIRIVATDVEVLEARVAQATLPQPDACIVARATCWHTARDPEYTAVVVRPDDGEAEAGPPADT
jgi:hypothetical protein